MWVLESLKFCSNDAAFCTWNEFIKWQGMIKLTVLVTWNKQQNCCDENSHNASRIRKQKLFASSAFQCECTMNSV